MRRFRRLRANPVMRRMVCETRLNAADFIYPIFVAEGNNIMKPVDSMPTVYQYSIDNLEQILPQIADSGISGLLIFGIPEKKDELATEAYNDKGVTQQAIRYIKSIILTCLLLRTFVFANIRAMDTAELSMATRYSMTALCRFCAKWR